MNDVIVMVQSSTLEHGATSPFFLVGVGYTGARVDGDSEAISGGVHFNASAQTALWKQEAVDAVVADAATHGWNVVRVIFPDFSSVKP